jgi:hypothetical protein
LGRGVSETIIANGADADAALLAGIGVPSRTSILGSGQMTGHPEVETADLNGASVITQDRPMVIT